MFGLMFRHHGRCPACEAAQFRHVVWDVRLISDAAM
jgi:hypothetical protein